MLMTARLIDLRRRLRAARIRQDDVARAAGVSRPYVCLVLRGRRAGPRVIETVHKLLEEDGR